MKRYRIALRPSGCAVEVYAVVTVAGVVRVSPGMVDGVEIPGGRFPDAVAAARDLGAAGHTVEVSVFGPVREPNSSRVSEGVVNRYRVQLKR